MTIPTALAQPLRMGNITAKNRIWQSPMWTRTASVGGEAVERVVEHYRARARGGAGLIIQEGTAVDGNHTWIETQLRLDEEHFIPSMCRITEAVHAYNTPILVQLHQVGMFGHDPVSPSGVACYSIGKQKYIQPRVLTVSEIEEIRDKFIQSAVYAKTAGYDGVEIHGSCAYLLEQFFSPHNNKRVDKYGGDVYRRSRLAQEIVGGIRKKLGPGFVIGYTSLDTDFHDDGVTREDNLILGKLLASEGIDFFDLQMSGTYETFHHKEVPGSTVRNPRGQLEMVQAYKKELGILVVSRAAGSNDPDEWNQAIEEGKVDAILSARLMLTDPDMAKKALSGRKEEIRQCIRCGNCYVTGVADLTNLSCTVNPGMGKGEPQMSLAPRKKNVVIAGGGPAGLEAARICAERGHTVTLFEAKDRLGGNQYIGSLPMYKDSLTLYIPWAERECRKSGVDIRLNEKATKESIAALKPDAVFVATGSSPIRPAIPGLDGENVILAEDVLTGAKSVKGKVIVLGGGEVGLETADLILEKSLADSVCVVEMRQEMGLDMGMMDKLSFSEYVFPAFLENGQLTLRTNTKVLEVKKEGVIVLIDGRTEIIEADTVVIALGYTSNNSLFTELSGGDADVFIVGDSVKPRRIFEAIHQAYEVARCV